jgi:hypothetical protein
MRTGKGVWGKREFHPATRRAIARFAGMTTSTGIPVCREARRADAGEAGIGAATALLQCGRPNVAELAIEWRAVLARLGSA